MTEILLPSGATVAASVTEREYGRLLGLPRGGAVDAAAAPLLSARAVEARGWYAAWGRPYVALRRVAIEAIADGEVRVVNGGVLDSSCLASRLRTAAAGELVVLAVSAGVEVAAEIERRWREDRPDEAFWLDRLAAAVAEWLLLEAAALTGLSRASRQESWLPHLSPGCADWGLAGQHGLLSLLTHGRSTAAIGPVRVLESGALWPPHSALAARGITQGPTARRPILACRACDFDPCQYRRCRSAGERQRETVSP